MSFFKDLKEDFSQAVNELLPEDTLIEDELETPQFDDDEIVNTLDEVSEEQLSAIINNTNYNIDIKADNLTEDIVQEDLLEEDINLEDIDLMEEADVAVDLEENYKDGIMDMDNDNVVLEMLEDEDININESENLKSPNVSSEDSGDVTVITKGTIINGSIISDGSLEVMGTIKGDVECSGKLSIIGSVTGNSMAAEVFVNTSRLEGSINSEGSVKIGVGTVVLGDITASSGVIAGAVKGEVDINGPVVIDSTAVVKGNINAASVQINNGAVVEGFCSLSYSSIDIDNFFEE